MEDFVDSCGSQGTGMKGKDAAFSWVGGMKRAPADAHIKVFSEPHASNFLQAAQNHLRKQRLAFYPFIALS